MYDLNGCRPQAQTLNLEIPIIIGVLVGEIRTSIVTHMLEDSHVGGTRGSCFKSENKVRLNFFSW
jgi:hypothetical protein